MTNPKAPKQISFDYQTNFAFPEDALFSPQLSRDTSFVELPFQRPSLLPRWSNDSNISNSNNSYSAISVEDVDRLRQIIKNMKSKRNDGNIKIKATKSSSSAFKESWLVCHTPNLSYSQYQQDGIYKYNTSKELKKVTTHSTVKHELFEPRWIPKSRPINNALRKDLTSMPWSYYKDITLQRQRNPQLNNKPDGSYFIFCQSSSNLINNSLRLSLINNLNKLEQDEEIKYDLRDVLNGKYLHHKIEEFGKQDITHKYMAYPSNDIACGRITPPRYYAPNDSDDSDSDIGITPRIPNLLDLKSNESTLSLMNIPSPMNRSLYKLRSSPSLHSQSSPSLLSNDSNDATLILGDVPNINYNNSQPNLMDDDSSTSTKSSSSYSSTSHSISAMYTNNGTKYKPNYNNDQQCMLYKCYDDDGKELSIINRNTAFIHDLIDPNKNILDHHLWIPSVFDCTLKKSSQIGFAGIIQSQIMGLDYVKYPSLYSDIGSIFKKMQKHFENLLNRKLTSSEKVIVQSKKCILQKYGDEYEEMMHQAGMGENIECVGIYIPEIYNKKRINLRLSFYKNSKFMKNDLSLCQGDSVVFSNECYSNINRIVHNNISANGEPIYYTILTFYLINKNEINIFTTNYNKLYVNLIFNWSYIISSWLKYYCKQSIDVIHYMSNSWMNGLIYLYLFGVDYDEYIYDRRQTMINEKQKVISKHESINIAVHLQAFLNEININQ